MVPGSGESGVLALGVTRLTILGGTALDALGLRAHTYKGTATPAERARVGRTRRPTRTGDPQPQSPTLP